MDPEYQKERFVTLRIKESVAKKFRKFCKEETTSQSVTLEAMLYHFERHQVRPGESLPTHLNQVEKKVLKRLNAIVSIIQEIEKKQTIPTVEMLQSLFLADIETQKQPPRMIEKKFKNRTLEEEFRQLKYDS